MERNPLPMIFVIGIMGFIFYLVWIFAPFQEPFEAEPVPQVTLVDSIAEDRYVITPKCQQPLLDTLLLYMNIDSALLLMAQAIGESGECLTSGLATKDKNLFGQKGNPAKEPCSFWSTKDWVDPSSLSKYKSYTLLGEEQDGKVLIRHQQPFRKFSSWKECIMYRINRWKTFKNYGGSSNSAYYKHLKKHFYKLKSNLKIYRNAKLSSSIRAINDEPILVQYSGRSYDDLFHGRVDRGHGILVQDQSKSQSRKQTYARARRSAGQQPESAREHDAVAKHGLRGFNLDLVKRNKRRTGNRRSVDIHNSRLAGDLDSIGLYVDVWQGNKRRKSKRSRVDKLSGYFCSINRHDIMDLGKLS